MNRKQRLRLNTSDNSFDFKTEQSQNDIIRDSTIIFPKKTITEEISSFSEIKTDPLELESSIFEEKPKIISINNQSKNERSFKNFFVLNHKTAPYFVIVALIFYIYFKPNDYTFLLEEVEKLRSQSLKPSFINRMENIASLSEGSYIGNHSKLYKFGFLLSSATDKNSILEPGMFQLTLKSNKGFFEINFKSKIKIQKFAIYHPAIANSESAIKDFSLLANDKRFNFQFKGEGYQEFIFEPQTVESLKVEFYSNYGETKYTSIYRIFVFA